MKKHDTPEFQKWFAGSKVATPEGQPLRVYHGTSKDVDFKSFKIGKRGAWFTTNPESASAFAADNDSQDTKYDPYSGKFNRINTAPRVIPAYLSMKNPYKMTDQDRAAHSAAIGYAGHQANHFQRLRDMGHDGVDFGNGVYVAFHPHQIKGIFNERPTEHKAFNKTEQLEKMMPGPRFPNLGFTDDRRETPIITDQKHLDTKARQVATRNVAYMESRMPPNKRDPYLRANTIDAHTEENKNYGGLADSTPGMEGNVLAFSRGSNLRNPRSAGGQHNMADLSTQEHENFHNMMNRVQGKYGQQARQNLARNLFDSVNVVNRGAMTRYFEKRYPIPTTHPLYHEEMLATMLNYLNNPAEREMFHNHMGDPLSTRRIAHDRIKSMHRQVHQAASQANEDWLKEDFVPDEAKDFPSQAHQPSLESPPAAMKPQPPVQAPAPIATAVPKKTKKPKGSNPNQLSLFKAEECYFVKAEEGDEVARMLHHPDVVERRMGLKLATVNDKHLARAFYDSSPEIQRAALEHPAMSHSALAALMRMPQSDSIQMLGMNHPLFEKDHLKALYDTHRSGGSKNVLDAIMANPLLDGDMIRDIYHDGNATRGTMSHAETPPDVLDDSILKHFTPGHDQKGSHRYLVMEALKHPQTSHNLVEKAIKEGDEGIKLAAAASPNLPPNVAEDILKRGHVTGTHAESYLRSALVSSPYASERHLDMGLDDLNPLVRSAVFKSASPNLSSKHVDRAIEQGHPHTIIMALKSAGADSSHIGKILNDKRAEVRALAESYQKKSAIKKFEQELAIFRKGAGDFGQQIDQNSEIVRDMLGYDHHKISTFEAAKYLIAGVDPTLEQTRKALWQADGDVEKAALLAYGMEPTESNLRALRAVRDIIGNRKGEPQAVHVQDVVAGVSDAEQAATAIKNAFDDDYVLPVDLGGKHSAGTLLARDMRGGKVYLLKPGSGGISPAAGDAEEAATQSRREAGFWAVAQSWNIGEYFPRTDLVLVDGKEYACIELLPWRYKTIDKLKKEDPTVGPNLLNPYLASGALHRWAVIDYVLGNPDRHANNLMADASGDTPTPDVKLIDHGSAMAGPDFDPAFDESSFVPYYLRAWASSSFNDLPTEGKLKVMPRISPQALDAFHGWIDEIHAHELQMILIRYGIDPGPALERLAKLKTMMTQEPADIAINKLWVTT